MERIETGFSDLKVQGFILPPRSTEYESPAPSPKLNCYRHLFKANAFIDIGEGRSLSCF
jgi:hypothetical protein